MTLRKVLREKVDLERKYLKAKKYTTRVKIYEELKKLNKLIDKEFKLC